jgi:hypothetical protein
LQDGLKFFPSYICASGNMTLWFLY